MASSATSRKAVALLILIFVLGIACGAVGIALINQRVYGALERQQEQPAPVRAVARLTHDVNLTGDQQKQLTTILNAMQNGYNGVRQEYAPQFEQIREDGRNQIRQILTPEQLPKFEDYLTRLDEDRRRRGLQLGQTR